MPKIGDVEELKTKQETLRKESPTLAHRSLGSSHADNMQS